MKRRDFLSLFGGAMAGGGALGGIAVLPRPAWSQTAKVYRVGTLTVGPPIPPTAGTGKILVEGLEQRGFTLGQNLAYEARGAAGNVSQTANLMQELKAANVDVVVTVSYPAAAAAKASGVPTVIAAGSGDPVKTGLVSRGRAAVSRGYPMTPQRCPQSGSDC